MRMPRPDRTGKRLTLEAAAFGLAYGSVLCWISTCIVASFRVDYLATPYWSALRGLRTDTCGAIAFIAAAVSLAVSEYLRMCRRQGGRAHLEGVRHRSPRRAALVALAESAAVTRTSLAAALSIHS